MKRRCVKKNGRRKINPPKEINFTIGNYIGQKLYIALYIGHNKELDTFLEEKFYTSTREKYLGRIRKRRRFKLTNNIKQKNDMALKGESWKSKFVNQMDELAVWQNN